MKKKWPMNFSCVQRKAVACDDKRLWLEIKIFNTVTSRMF